MVLLGFYVLHTLQNVFDSEFYGLGKTDYMLFESKEDKHPGGRIECQTF